MIRCIFHSKIHNERYKILDEKTDSWAKAIDEDGFFVFITSRFEKAEDIMIDIHGGLERFVGASLDIPDR